MARGKQNRHLSHAPHDTTKTDDFYVSTCRIDHGMVFSSAHYRWCRWRVDTTFHQMAKSNVCIRSILYGLAIILSTLFTTMGIAHSFPNLELFQSTSNKTCCFSVYTQGHEGNNIVSYTGMIKGVGRTEFRKLSGEALIDTSTAIKFANSNKELFSYIRRNDLTEIPPSSSVSLKGGINIHNVVGTELSCNWPYMPSVTLGQASGKSIGISFIRHDHRAIYQNTVFNCSGVQKSETILEMIMPTPPELYQISDTLVLLSFDSPEQYIVISAETIRRLINENWPYPGMELGKSDLFMVNSALMEDEYNRMVTGDLTPGHALNQSVNKLHGWRNENGK